MAFYHQKYHPNIYSVLQQNDSMQLSTDFTENEEIYPLFGPINRRGQKEKRERPSGLEVASVRLDPGKPRVGQARPDTIISQS